MKDLCLKNKSRLLGVCDISCDLEGSIGFLKKFFFFYYKNKLNKRTKEIVSKSVDKKEKRKEKG